MHAMGPAYTDRNSRFFQNGSELTNDSDIPDTVHFFLEYDTDITDKNHLINQQSRKSRKSALGRKCSAPETFFGLICYTY